MYVALGHVWIVRWRAVDGKRAVDLGLTLLALPLLCPLITVLALAVWLADGRAPFHWQWRVGRGGRMFRLWKLRSMVPGAEERLGHVLAGDPTLAAEWRRQGKLRRDPRVTRLGGVLRRYALDELPQFFNVLCGEMSLVGPRPVTGPEFEARYRDADGTAYARLRPGLTGLWQVYGRGRCSYADRVALDRYYAQMRDMRLDLVILWRTVAVVLRGEGW